MSDNYLTDKLSESIITTFKKTELFEKIDKVHFYVTSFVLLSSIMGLTCVYLNYSSNTELQYVKDKIDNNDNILKSNIELNRRRNLIEHCKIKSEVLNLERYLSEIIENQGIIINHLKEIKLLKNPADIKLIVKNDTVSASTSMTSFSPIKVPNLVAEFNLDVTEDNNDQDYDELLNECYDNMPLNNAKKNMTLSWLFK